MNNHTNLIMEWIAEIIDKLPAGTTFTAQQMAAATKRMGSGHYAIGTIRAYGAIRKMVGVTVEVVGKVNGQTVYRKMGAPTC